MKLEELNFNIPFTKSDGSIIINPKAWENDGRLVQAYNFKGEHTISNINKVLKTNYNTDIYGNFVNEGDIVAISRQASRISYLSPYKIADIEGEFANVHLLQVLGKFEGGEITYESFTPLYNKVVMKKLLSETDSILDLGDTNRTVIGEVLKVGPYGFDENYNRIPLNTKVGQKVLVRDNITTEINLDNKDYIMTEDCMIVGYFKSEATFENLVLFNNMILLKKAENKKVEGSSFLLKPEEVNDNISDVNEFYTDNRFTVVKVADNININVNDNVIVSEDFLNYVTIAGKKYYLLEGTRYIYGVYN